MITVRQKLEILAYFLPLCGEKKKEAQMQPFTSGDIIHIITSVPCLEYN